MLGRHLLLVDARCNDKSLNRARFQSTENGSDGKNVLLRGVVCGM